MTRDHFHKRKRMQEGVDLARLADPGKNEEAPGTEEDRLLADRDMSHNRIGGIVGDGGGSLLPLPVVQEEEEGLYKVPRE